MFFAIYLVVNCIAYRSIYDSIVMSSNPTDWYKMSSRKSKLIRGASSSAMGTSSSGKEVPERYELVLNHE